MAQIFMLLGPEFRMLEMQEEATEVTKYQPKSIVNIIFKQKQMKLQWLSFIWCQQDAKTYPADTDTKAWYLNERGHNSD